MEMLHISLPSPMRHYVDQQVSARHVSAEEYIQQLIRDDQQRTTSPEAQQLHTYLDLCARQLDAGQTGTLSIDEILAQGRASRISQQD